jgi:glycosyltransferase involved in cell wall biosynthesis
MHEEEVGPAALPTAADSAPSPPSGGALATAVSPGLRLGFLVDLVLWRTPRGWASDDAFLRFLVAFKPFFPHLVLCARVVPEAGVPAVEVAAGEIEVVPLPAYRSLAGLLSSPLGYWPAVGRALGDLLGRIDVLWLNFGHPVSLAALPLARRRGVRGFAALRGDYARDARLHVSPCLAPLAGATMAGLMRAFAWEARRQGLPCLAMSAREETWLRARGIEATVVPVSLLERAARPRPGEPGPARLADVVAIGRLDPTKGFDVLLKTVAPLVTPEGRPVTLALVGDGPEKGLLEALARDLELTDRVRFIGRVPPGPRLWALYRGARVVAIPSRTEGTPAVAREAMALGQPLVATAVGGLPALIGDRCGWLVPPGDAEALGRALAAALRGDDDARARAAAACEVARDWTLEGSVAGVVERLLAWGVAPRAGDRGARARGGVGGGR